MKSNKFLFKYLIFTIIFFYFKSFINNEIISGHLLSSYTLKENEFFLNQSTIQFLNDKLTVADKNLIPKLKNDSNGKTIYSYKRTKFSPILSISEIQQLISNPPSFKKERSYIKDIIDLLHQLDISVIIVNFKNNDIAGTWDPKSKLVKLNISIIESGTKNFLTILNHEVIHIAQSCSNGGVNKNPKLIGLNLKLNKEKNHLLSSKIYRNISNRELEFEKEAYSYQDDFIISQKLIKRYCI